jgi:aminoglycoside phosphotransferase (APT) family kinase protein
VNPADPLAAFVRRALSVECADRFAEAFWSVVYDLGDGTLAKVVRDPPGQPGKAVRHFTHEGAVLGFLTDVRLPAPVPRLLQAVAADAAGAPAGVAGVLRIEKLPGRAWNGKGARTALAAQLAEFLDAFHRLPPEPFLRIAPAMSRSVRIAKSTIAWARREDDCALALRLRALLDHVPPDHLRPVHGDMHGMNLLVSEGSLTGVIDFASSCVDLPECEWAHLVPDPPLDARVRREYRRRGGALRDEYVALSAALCALWGALDRERRGDAEGAHSRRLVLARCLEELPERR